MNPEPTLSSAYSQVAPAHHPWTSLKFSANTGCESRLKNSLFSSSPEASRLVESRHKLIVIWDEAWGGPFSPLLPAKWWVSITQFLHLETCLACLWLSRGSPSLRDRAWGLWQPHCWPYFPHFPGLSPWAHSPFCAFFPEVLPPGIPSPLDPTFFSYLIDLCSSPLTHPHSTPKKDPASFLFQLSFVSVLHKGKCYMCWHLTGECALPF